MNALVSIITPAFNSEKYISETINSVLNQTYKNWELLIVDDCSTDKTFEIAKNFSLNDNRVKAYQLKYNTGPGFARNFATKIVKGNYIAFLDADDLWKPEKLEKQLAFLQKNNLPFTFSFYDLIDENGKSLAITQTSPKEINYKQLFFCNWIGNLTGIYSVDYFGELEISYFKKRQDWLLYLDILKQIKTAKPTPESLAFYRVRRKSLSSNKLKLLKDNFNVYYIHHEQNLFFAAFNLLLFLFVQLFVKPQYKIKH